MEYGIGRRLDEDRGVALLHYSNYSLAAYVR